jgi:hypothetical protein
MRIGIVSDTHRNSQSLERVVDWMMAKMHIVSLYHLGDDYDDVAGLAETGLEVVQVPGVYHKGYLDGSVPAKAHESVLGLQILLVHSFEKDGTDEDRRVNDIILHGHTHRAELELEDGLFMMNPGHLKSHKDKNMEPTFGLLDIQDRTVRACLFDTQYQEIESMDMIRTESGLYRE